MEGPSQGYRDPPPGGGGLHIAAALEPGVGVHRRGFVGPVCWTELFQKTARSQSPHMSVPVFGLGR